MKKRKFISMSILGLLAGTFVCGAQPITQPGWYRAQHRPAPPAHPGSPTLSAASLDMPTTPCIAEAITPQIQALARGLENDPLRIFNYVHDHIRQVLYFGSKKGAQLTLLEKSGNDFDQCALLVALLAYFMTPNSKGKSIVAVIVITLLALLVRWQGGYSVA